MMLTITGNRMMLHAEGVLVVDATRRPDGRWDVSTWPVPLGRDQAITTLIITELLARGYPRAIHLSSHSATNSPDNWAGLPATTEIVMTWTPQVDTPVSGERGEGHPVKEVGDG